MYSAQIIKNMNTKEFIAIFKIGICNFILEPVREHKTPANKDNYMKEKGYFYKLSRYEGDFATGLKYFYTKFIVDKFSKENLEDCIDRSFKYILGYEFEKENGSYKPLRDIGFSYYDARYTDTNFCIKYKINEEYYSAKIERAGAIRTNSFLGFVFTICDKNDKCLAVKTDIKCADFYTIRKCIYEYHSSIKEG